MAKIETVDYEKLSKQTVGRPKIYNDKGNHVFSIQLKTPLSSGYKKVKFKIRHGFPSIYFTNRETSVLKEDEYLNQIEDNIFNLEFENINEGIYDISSVGYHWFKLTPSEKETENCCVIKKIRSN